MAPRIDPLPRDQASEAVRELYSQVFGDRDPVAEPGSPSGTPGDWWTAWGRVPGILAAFRAYPAADSPLDEKLRELAILRTGYVKASQFVFSQHSKSARRAGVPEAKIAATPYWSISDVFDPVERTVLAYVDALVLEGGRVHERLFAQLRGALSQEDILVLTYFINMYALHATSTKALRLEYDNVPERVVEIPAPEGGGVQNWRDPAWAESAER